MANRLFSGTMWRALALVGVAAIDSAFGQAPMPAPARPYVLGSANSGAATVRILQAGWLPESLVVARPGDPGDPAPPYAFFIKFALDGMSYGQSLAGREAATWVSVDRGFGWPLYPYGAVNGQQDTRVWTAMRQTIDPRASHVSLHFFVNPPDGYRDPAAEAVTLKVPVPSAPGEMTPLPGGPVTAVSRSGVRVRVDGAQLVLIDPQRGWYQLSMNARLFPPDADPGRNFTLLDSAGAGNGSHLTYSDEPANGSPHAILCDADPYSHRYLLRADGFLGANFANLTLQFIARPPGAPEAGTAFDLTLPMPAPPKPSAAAASPVQVQTFAGGRFALQPMMRAEDEPPASARWEGTVLWDKAEAGGANSEWRLAPVSENLLWYLDLVPGASRNWPTLVPLGWDVPWRSDGTPLGPGEATFQAIVLAKAYSGHPLPTTSDIPLQFQRIRSIDFNFHFHDIPVPVEGQIILANIRVRTGAFGSLVVRKIGWFDEAKSFSPALAKLRRMQPPFGLAVVVELVPKHPEPTFCWAPACLSSWSMSPSSARDSAGHDLLRHDFWVLPTSLPVGDYLDATPGRGTLGPGGDFATFFLLPPVPGARKFDLTLAAIRRVILESQTVTFHDVPLPAPAGG